MNDQRIIDFETKLAHQEYLLSQLNQVMTDQQEAINGLQAAVKVLLKNLQDGAGVNPAATPVNEKPPHY